MKLVVLGSYALEAWQIVRLLRKPPELARRGRMLTSIIFVAFWGADDLVCPDPT
ncbi:hypothetical protein [Mesorhizobium sp.]|uniref:hypothetical protein n=1 Tax=Mesorhizobium sp. TaxID=1871066 RepID=UPI0025FCC4A6|nr:hypothetical protein [Mesorhizobium sp.]